MAKLPFILSFLALQLTEEGKCWGECEVRERISGARMYGLDWPTKNCVCLSYEMWLYHVTVP